MKSQLHCNVKMLEEIKITMIWWTKSRPFLFLFSLSSIHLTFLSIYYSLQHIGSAQVKTTFYSDLGISMEMRDVFLEISTSDKNFKHILGPYWIQNVFFTLLVPEKLWENKKLALSLLVLRLNFRKFLKM